MTNRVRVRAAGVLPYRITDGALEIALVHRPHYDDWSFAKGKLDRAEDWAAAAVREALEETGLRVRLGMPLPDSFYLLGSRLKRVRYWAATVVGGDGALEHEIDAVEWLSPKEARRRLSYPHDQVQLQALLDLSRSGRLETWPLLVVRHALAQSRGSWEGPDPLRPLTDEGHRRATVMAGLLDAYEPRTVLTSPSVRCVDTVVPYEQLRGVTLTQKKGLSEEGFESDPSKVHRHLTKLLAAGRPAALCSHGPLFPTVLTMVRGLADDSLHKGDRQLLSRLIKVQPDKGEVLALTMHGTGEAARVVAVERHRP